MNLTIIDPQSRFLGHQVRISYGPFSLRDMGLVLGMKQPIPVIILGIGRPEELETVVEAKHLLITEDAPIHCTGCGAANPKLRQATPIFTDECQLTECCGAFQCFPNRETSEWPYGGPEIEEMSDEELDRLPTITACCEAHADRAAKAINVNFRAIHW